MKNVDYMENINQKFNQMKKDLNALIFDEMKTNGSIKSDPVIIVNPKHKGTLGPFIADNPGITVVWDKNCEEAKVYVVTKSVLADELRRVLGR